MRRKGRKKGNKIKKSFNNLKKAFYYARQQKKELILFFIFNLIFCFLGTIAPLLTAKELIALTDGLLIQLLEIALAVLVVEISLNFGRYFSRKYAQIFTREILKKIQLDMAREILRIETSELDKKSSGVFIDRLVKDTSRISDIFLDVTIQTTELFAEVGILIAIFVVSRLFFLYYVIFILIIFFLEKKRVHKFNELDKHYRKSAEATTGFVGELVRGIRDIKVLNAGDSFMAEMNERINKINEERYEMSQVTRKYSLFVGSVRDLLDFILILLAIYAIKNKLISVANFVIIYMYKGRVFNLLHLFGNFMEWFKDFNLSCSRVFEIIDDTTFKKENFGTEHLNKVKGNFEFKDVYFGYNENKMVLKGVYFKVKHNQTISFVGKSGSGKSTIFSLLARLYPITKGQILIDGHDINELDQETIRGNISIITQNPYIFNMSIRENLTIVKNDLTENEMIKACKLACLHDFIMSLPEGYDTLVGEGGLTLSGGQKQRLAIARAFVQKTQIILFDEATSALDNETQENIQKAIHNLKDHYTVLIIAHRLSTVIDSDQILLVENGKITATGTHEELLESNNTYKNLYNKELKN